MAETMTLADHFRAFAESSARDGAVTYATICRGVADDPELLDLMARAPVTQRRPNLLLAAVHFLLLGGARAPLGHPLRHRRGLSRDGSDGPVAPVGRPRPEFKDFCMTHRDELLELIATGSTQTNEVGRCTALLPALSHIAAGYDRGRASGPARPGHLGRPQPALRPLCLHLPPPRWRGGATVTSDRADAGRPAIRPRRCGSSAPCGASSLDCPPWSCRRSPTGPGSTAPPSTPVTKTGPAGSWPACGRTTCPASPACAPPWRSPAPIPTRRSCTPATWSTTLAAVAATVAPGQPLVVFHSWVAAYLTEARQRELVDAVRALSTSRPVHYLYAESPVDTPRTAHAPVAANRARPRDVATALVHVPPGGAAGPVGRHAPPRQVAALVALAGVPGSRSPRHLEPRLEPRSAPTGRHVGPEPAPRRR